MNAWSGRSEDAMGPTVTRAASAKPESPPPLKNGTELRESGYLIAVGSRTARFRRRYKSRLGVLVLLLLLLLLLCLAITMTVLYIKQKRHKPVKLCDSKECLRSAANLAISMDKTVDPCEDFHQYSCGNWVEDHPRPDAYTSYDWFRDKQTKVYSMVRDFLNKNISNLPRPVRQAKDMYAACMDVEKIEHVGLKPVFSILESLGLPSHPKILNVTGTDLVNYTYDWLETVINVKVQMGMDVLIGFDIFTDPKNSSEFRLVMGSPETTNPFPSMFERRRHKDMKYPFKRSKRKDFTDFLLDNEDEKLAQLHKLYHAELMKIIFDKENDNNTVLSDYEMLTRFSRAAEVYYYINQDLYELESSNSTEDDDDDNINIPEYTVDEIQTFTDAFVLSFNATPSPIWKRYLEGIFKISDVTLDFKNDKVLVSQPDMIYMGQMATYVANIPDYELELYTWMKVVEVMAVHTITEIRSLFYRTYYETRPLESSIPPRSLHCASAVNDMLGMAIAYGIVDPHFLSVTKPKVEEMIDELKNALAHLVGQVNWMDDNTKLATYLKIIQMKTLIGFPEWLFEKGELEKYYDGIEVDRKKHLANMINIIQVKVKKGLNQLHQTNNFGWSTDPTEVNAYHTFQENTITVPLVMLQHPFFDLGLDSLNYGSLGTVLGHEITHGFDNFGRRFDKDGNMVPWWTNDTIDSFVNMTKCFIKQYSTYFLPEVNEHVDGKKTLGENIADNGGLREALAALRHHLRRHGPEPKLPGFEHMTAEQMFFLSYGNLWCGISTKSSIQADLEDEHSPLHFRARGSLQNSEDFARAFRCRPGSPMNPQQRCVIF
ncbi:endothelin-converting enzyme 2 [Manduca sexta]|uniref:endothelin-converting enzyme 2 n=1 Tax=Manduca sexta TaxID=7130 RepID=UPI00188FB5FD|nr:endothelin-converting enzyme 2 [Manduca sexta]